MKLDDLIELHKGHAEFWGTRNTLHRDTADALRLCKALVDAVSEKTDRISKGQRTDTALAALRDAGLIERGG